MRNGFGEPESVTTLQGGATLYAETYARDDLGRITTKTERRGATTRTFAYAYDDADRLARVDARRRAASDLQLRRQRQPHRGHARRGPPITAAYDAQDRLVRFGTTEYAYTRRRRAATASATEPSGETTTYAYDAIGALTAVRCRAGPSIEYVIDAAGRRVAKKRDGQVVQRFLYGPGLGPVAELEADGSVQQPLRLCDRSNVPDYMIRGGQRYRIVTDQLGSPRVVVNADTGAVAQEIEYDEFGRVTSDTNPGFQPFGFAGGLYDARHETRALRRARLRPRDRPLHRRRTRSGSPAATRTSTATSCRIRSTLTDATGHVPDLHPDLSARSSAPASISASRSSATSSAAAVRSTTSTGARSP